MWSELLSAAMDKSHIHFDTENNDAAIEGGGQRSITVPQDHWDTSKCTFRCELYQAGGDWEYPVFYFRCQLTSGYARGCSKHSEPFFCFIPDVKQGNAHLEKSKDGWITPNNSEGELKVDPVPAECWKALKGYLNKLVEQEIREAPDVVDLEENK